MFVPHNYVFIHTPLLSLTFTASSKSEGSPSQRLENVAKKPEDKKEVFRPLKPAVRMAQTRFHLFQTWDLFLKKCWEASSCFWGAHRRLDESHGITSPPHTVVPLPQASLPTSRPQQDKTFSWPIMALVDSQPYKETVGRAQCFT